MNPLRLCTVVGARPQLIKAAAVSAAFAEWNRGGARPIVETIIHTGQHYDDAMSGVFFRQLGLPEPALNLGINGLTPSGATAAMLAALARVFTEFCPDVILVYGDTTSSLAATIAAEQLQRPMAHVEAGPRMGNRDHPEEFNRIVADHAGAWLFCPSELAAANLRRENVTGRIEVVGDVMFDAVLRHRDHAHPTGWVPGFVLATVHRPQNTERAERLAAIMAGLGDTARPVLFPCHPRTRNALAAHGIAIPKNVTVVDPLDYQSLLGALRDCAYVVTDSGGLPKEAFFMGKRSLTVSSETPWPELIAIEATKVVDADAGAIVASSSWACGQPLAATPFGDGRAGSRIARILTGASR